MTDGLLTLPFVPSLSARLDEIGWCTIQIVLSSSYQAYGFSSLDRDAEEIAMLLEHLSHTTGLEKTFLLGHSTGCQDILRYLRGGMGNTHNVIGVMLQGAISDRDYLRTTLPNWRTLLEQAKEAIANGDGDTLSSDLINGAPMTFNRILALIGRLEDDDYFSIDLSVEERQSKFGAITIPTFVQFCADDEYFPDKAAYADLSGSFEAVSSQIKVLSLLSGADHAISSPEAQEIFVSRVVEIVQSLQ
jgi:pimeloyl-ACP methyl ester carboxylesterase